MFERLTIAIALVFVVECPVRGDDVVRTPEGVPLKAIVRADTAVYQTPDVKSPAMPANVFQFYYILDPGPQPAGGANPGVGALRNGFYRISTTPNARDQVG